MAQGRAAGAAGAAGRVNGAQHVAAPPEKIAGDHQGPGDIVKMDFDTLVARLGASAAECAALRASIDGAKQRIATIFSMAAEDAGPTPAAYILNQMQQGLEVESAGARARLFTQIAERKTAATGSTYAALIHAAHAEGLADACAALRPEAALELRAALAGRAVTEIATGFDPMPAAIHAARADTVFETWEELRDTLDFSPASTQRLLDQFLVLKEQLISVLCAAPEGGGEAPLDYQARLLAAGDPEAGASVDAYLKARIAPGFRKPYAEVLAWLENGRRSWLELHASTEERLRLQTIWRQSLLTLTLPGDRFRKALLERVGKIRGAVYADLGAEARLGWAEFCAALLLTSAQEEDARRAMAQLHAAAAAAPQDLAKALAAEAEARRTLEATFSAQQRRRWAAFERRSLLSVAIL
jgi:hypothetical protein